MDLDYLGPQRVDGNAKTGTKTCNVNGQHVNVNGQRVNGDENV